MLDSDLRHYDTPVKTKCQRIVVTLTQSVIKGTPPGPTWRRAILPPPSLQALPPQPVGIAHPPALIKGFQCLALPALALDFA
jgi:hypothetical protein